MSVKERAIEHFNSGFYCAESVLLAVTEEKGIQSDIIPAIATGFCGGVSRTCGMCGAVSGALMSLNIIYGRNKISQTVEKAYIKTNQFLKRFTDEFGSANCRDLSGCDLSSEKERQRFHDENIMEKCAGFTGRAAELALELIEE